MNFKSYIHDKQLIFTNLVMALIGLYTVLLVVLRVDTTQTLAIIRYNTTLGLAGFEKANTTDLYQLAMISALVFVVHTFMAIRMREQKRAYASIALTLGIVAQIFLVIIASSILSLHR